MQLTATHQQAEEMLAQFCDTDVLELRLHHTCNTLQHTAKR